MKGSESKLVHYMQGANKRFVIPVYQRNYDWKIEHCKQLYDDLIKVIRQERKSHFFGSVVSVFNPDGHKVEFLIIDGQQRLTTITLLFLAVYNLIQEGKVASTSPHLAQMLYEDYLVDKWQPEETRIKLKPIKNDQMAFGRLFSDAEEYVADSNLTINYSYFYDRILREEITVDEIFEAASALEIINISLNNDDNPQLIFESLNSTGLDLSEGDKIRNYILMGLPSRQQELLYDNYWNKIEHNTGFDVSAFVRDYLSIKLQSIPTMSNVYFKFKEYVEGIKDFILEDLLKDLLSYSKKYEYLIKSCSPWDKVNQSIYRLNRIRTTVSRPFLLEALRMKETDKLTEKELYMIFQAIENYVFRRYVCEITTNSLNKIFLLLHNDIMRMDGSENNYFEKFKFVLLSKKESGRYPDDEEFREALSTRNVYNMRGENKLYLFERLENANTVETKAVWEHLDRGDYSIEHIMPQQLTAVWVKELGDGYEYIHQTWLHRLANLTLTGYNSEYSNHPFTEKRDREKGFKQSGLRLNVWIGQCDKWGEAELEERNEVLLDSAIEIWPDLTTDYEPPKKQVDSVTLDDEIAFTGKVISSFSLMGSEQSAESWTDMYHKVLMQLHSGDKSVLTRLAVCKDDTVDLSIHFSTSNESFSTCRQIDNNIYVWTATGTQYKINLLRKVFSLFNIDPIELVFYLREDSNLETNYSRRHDLRREYWEYLLPQLRDATGIFNNVNPSTMNWINGYPGYGGIAIACVANLDSARVELYIDMTPKERNKELFDFLYARKTDIEAIADMSFAWDRRDDIKASKIYRTLEDVGIFNKDDWPRIAEFQVNTCRTIVGVFDCFLHEYFDMS